MQKYGNFNGAATMAFITIRIFMLYSFSQTCAINVARVVVCQLHGIHPYVCVSVYMCAGVFRQLLASLSF